MTPPRQIYASSVSRRDRSWGRHPRRAGSYLLAVLVVLTVLAASALIAARMAL